MLNHSCVFTAIYKEHIVDLDAENRSKPGGGMTMHAFNIQKDPGSGRIIVEFVCPFSEQGKNTVCTYLREALRDAIRVICWTASNRLRIIVSMQNFAENLLCIEQLLQSWQRRVQQMFKQQTAGA